jgi:hypothetical protein
VLTVKTAQIAQTHFTASISPTIFAYQNPKRKMHVLEKRT